MMNDYVLAGFNDEMEKVALMGFIAKTGLKAGMAAIKPVAKTVVKNPLTSMFTAAGLHDSAKKTSRAITGTYVR